MKFSKNILVVLLLLSLSMLVISCSDDKKETTGASSGGDMQEAVPLTGKVLETFDSGGYTYVRLDTGAKEAWAALPPTLLTVGEQITLAGVMLMPNFHSTTLDRTFEQIFFSSGLIADTGRNASAVGGGMPPASGGPMGGWTGAVQASSNSPEQAAMPEQATTPSLPFVEIHIEKAPGANGYSVSELFAKGKELSGKTVAVRGQVVKITKNIMGKNWLHIQDGTGNPDGADYDMVATVEDIPELNAVVIIEGPLRVDHQVGSIHSYPILLEDARIVQ